MDYALIVATHLCDASMPCAVKINRVGLALVGMHWQGANCAGVGTDT